MITTIHLRRGTAAQWTTADPILGSGEPGLETDTTKVKWGDGVTHWTALPYSAASAGEFAALAAQKGQPSGLATLDGGGFVPDGQIGATIARDAEVSAAVAAESTARDQAISTAINALVNGAPGLLDTLGEIAAQLGVDESAAAALTTAVNARLTKALYDANSIVKADVDDTPVVLPVPSSTLIGRGASGVISALTVAQVKALLVLSSADLSDVASLATTTALSAAIASEVTARNAAIAAQHTADNGAYFPLAATAAALPAGTHVAHRGNTQVNLEETLEAFRAAVANGARAIKCDVSPLATGALAVMHDLTTTRTTTTTGNVSDHTPASWANLVVPGTLLGPGAANSKPPLWEDVLNEFGGQVVIMVEEKDLTTGGTAVLNSIVRRGLQKSVVVINTDATLASLAPFVAAGIPVMFQYNGLPITAPTPQAVIAAGATFIDIGYSYTDAQIQTVAAACAAAGVRLFGFTCKRRFEAARMLSLGCTDIVSDQAAYTSVTGQIASADRFKVGVPMLGVSVNNDQALNWLGAAGAYRRAFPASQSDVYECQGYLATSKTTYTISGTLTLDANDSDTTRHPGIWVGCPDDAPLTDGNVNQSGYHCFIRTNGQLQISRATRGATVNGTVSGGSATNLGNASSSALVVGSSYPFTIQVTPTQVIFTINGQTVTATDATFRGPYCYIGKTGGGGLAASYSGLSISPTG